MRSTTPLGLLLLATLSGCPSAPAASPTPAPLSPVTPPNSGPATPAPTISPVSQASDDFLIVPARGFGPITIESTEATLKERFGDDARVEKIYLGEGQEVEGLAIYPEQPEKRVEIVWSAEHPEKIELLQIHGKTSDWKTAQGVTLGTTLVELEKLNGKPFDLMGLNWDFGGNVTDWKGGALEGLNLRVNDTDVALSEEENLKISGDQTISSDNPVMQKANPKVSLITMSFTLPQPATTAAPAASATP